MILKISVADEELFVDVPDSVLTEAEAFFVKMDRDMDHGWRMGRQYVEDPTITQRCQIAADRLLTALHQENEHTKLLMAGYILSRMPKVERVIIDHTGSMQNTEFEHRP
jgi:hypothetical protein